ncbi:MAG: PIG-L family deacetylase [Planctomycetota bacterium]
MSKKLIVLAVGAHPDDIEFLCAGTLARYTKAGHKVFVCHLCSGNRGHTEIPMNQLGRIRTQEARDAAKIIGAEPLTTGFDDVDIYVEREAMLRCVDLVRQVKPDVIITHSPDDYMPDHTATSKLMMDASFIATVPLTVTEHEAHKKLAGVYYMDNMGGFHFEPTDYVDISETIEIKRQMLLCHKSQEKWLREHDGINIIEFMETLSRFRGMQCGVAFAEGFRQAMDWGRVGTSRLLL